MRIEDVTKNKVSKVGDKELLILKLRFTQLWDKVFEGNSKAVVGSLNRNQFLKNYRVLLNEMNTRSVEHSTSPIDKAAFKKAMTLSKFGIDVTDFENVTVLPNAVFVSPDSVESTSEMIEKKLSLISELFKNDEGPDSMFIPVYDLVLVAKQDTTIEEISKPYPDEHSARLQSPDMKHTRVRRTHGSGDGKIQGVSIPESIDIIWFIVSKEGKEVPIAQALRFPIKAWTSIKAKKWLKDKEITYKSFEEGGEKKEKEKEVSKFISVYRFDKADEDEHIVCGIVYEPDVVDSQGDKASEREIRKAAYRFMEDVQSFKVNHQGKNIKAKVLESYIAPDNFKVSSKKVKKGTWVLTLRVFDEDAWEAIKKGDLTGFSMAGTAKTTQ